MGRGLGQGLRDRVVLCLCELRSSYMYIVLGGHLRILGTPSVQSCCALWMSAS